MGIYPYKMVLLYLIVIIYPPPIDDYINFFDEFFIFLIDINISYYTILGDLNFILFIFISSYIIQIYIYTYIIYSS